MESSIECVLCAKVDLHNYISIIIMWCGHTKLLGLGDVNVHGTGLEMLGDNSRSQQPSSYRLSPHVELVHCDLDSLTLHAI